MTGFHVTHYENLDSILSSGLIPSITTENNFPFAADNRHEARIFFMSEFEAAIYWYRVHHPSWINNDFGNPTEKRESVIIEFELDEFNCYPDPYQNEGDRMSCAYFVTENIAPEKIVDIHEPDIVF